MCGARDRMTPRLEVGLVGLGPAWIHRCAGCGFRQIRPRPRPADLAALYGEDYFDPDVRSGFREYAAQRQRYEREAYFLARTLRRMASRGRLLEVGSGLGFLLHALARASGWEVEGVELSPFGARYARERFGLTVRRGTLEEVRLPSGRFDFVVQKDLLEHVGHPRRLLEETGRVMRPGARLWLITPNGEADVRPLAAASGSGADVLPVLDQGHLSFFTRAQLLRLAAEAGVPVRPAAGYRRPPGAARARLAARPGRAGAGDDAPRTGGDRSHGGRGRRRRRRGARRRRRRGARRRRRRGARRWRLRRGRCLPDAGGGPRSGDGAAAPARARLDTLLSLPALDEGHRRACGVADGGPRLRPPAREGMMARSRRAPPSDGGRTSGGRRRASRGPLRNGEEARIPMVRSKREVSSRRSVGGPVAAAAVAGALFLPAVAARAGERQEGRSVSDGVYTSEQAGRGRREYIQHCATCHSTNLRGGEMAPGLVGDTFLGGWSGATLWSLFDFSMATMPQDNPGSTSPAAMNAILAYVPARERLRPGRGGARARPGRRGRSDHHRLIEARRPGSRAGPARAPARLAHRRWAGPGAGGHPARPRRAGARSFRRPNAVSGRGPGQRRGRST